MYSKGTTLVIYSHNNKPISVMNSQFHVKFQAPLIPIVVLLPSCHFPNHQLWSFALACWGGREQGGVCVGQQHQACLVACIWLTCGHSCELLRGSLTRAIQSSLFCSNVLTAPQLWHQFGPCSFSMVASLVAQSVKNPAAMQET